MNTEVQAMEKLLTALFEDHQLLLKCIERKRQAIATAQINLVADLVHEEQTIIKRVAEVERHRIALVRRMSRIIKPDTQDELSMREITEAIVDQPQRTRIEALAAQLRDAVTQVRKESSVVRAAAEALARHMNGVMQSVQSALSRAGIYSHNGHIATGAQLEFNIDIKS